MNVKLRILRLLLEEEPDISLREVARQLGISSSLTHYHMSEMAKLGVLIHTPTGIRAGTYIPQKIFYEDVDDTVYSLKRMAEKVVHCNGDKLGNCIKLFLKCQKNL